MSRLTIDWAEKRGDTSRSAFDVPEACHLLQRTSCSFHGKIQDKDDDYYMQFNLVICGLDSVDARRWMSATLVNLVDPEAPESLKPLIDGGTEGARLSRAAPNFRTTAVVLIFQRY